MIDVTVADEVYRRCKLPSVILERIRQRVIITLADQDPKKFKKARKTWVETIVDEGTWYVVPIRVETPGEHVVIINPPYPTKPRKTKGYR